MFVLIIHVSLYSMAFLYSVEATLVYKVWMCVVGVRKHVLPLVLIQYYRAAWNTTLTAVFCLHQLTHIHEWLAMTG